MSWKLNNAGDACVSCDHPECTAEVVHWLEKDDHAAASESAMAAGWWVSPDVGGEDFCAAHNPEDIDP